MSRHVTDAVLLASIWILSKPLSLVRRVRFPNSSPFISSTFPSDFKNVIRVDPQCHEARGELAIAHEQWEEGEGDETGNNTSEDEAPLPEEDPDDSDDDEHHIGRAPS